MIRVNTKSLQQRVLELTGTFETTYRPPKCYSVVSGNFDGAGISYGVLQFNLKSGTLQDILKYSLSNDSSLLLNKKDLKEDLKDILKGSLKDQLKWAESITSSENKRIVVAPWRDFFKALGETPECQQAQLRAAQYYLDRAKHYMQLFGFISERAYAFCFDVAVQNGSFGMDVYQKAMEAFNKVGNLNEVAKLQTLAHFKADVVKPEWKGDVLNRKLTIATGGGTVHGMKVNLQEDFGITLNKALL